MKRVEIESETMREKGVDEGERGIWRKKEIQWVERKFEQRELEERDGGVLRERGKLKKVG